MNLLKKILSLDSLITIITGALFVFFMDLYGMHQNYLYLIASLVFTVVYLIFIYKMSKNKYEPVIVNLCAKIFPMFILTFLGIIVLHKKYNLYTFFGLALFIVGAIMISN
jgi:uncharacterized membrane protein